MMEALAEGARQALSVSIPCGAAGILIGVVGYTGIGLRFSSLIIALSGGFLLLAMVLVMIGTIVLGMGMPTSGAYITAAVLLAPALSGLGISQLGAHLFIFFFAALSMITPTTPLSVMRKERLSSPTRSIRSSTPTRVISSRAGMWPVFEGL